MSNNTVWGLLIVIVLIGGFIWYTNSSDMQMQMADDLGSYTYMCESGMEFTMMPSSDVSSIQLAPGAGASFATTTLAKTDSSAGQRFEGGGMVFVGAGEGVMLTTGGTTYTCEPKPSADMAPWNWGDTGEGAGSIQPEVSLVVSESIVGKWQSTDDAKSVREFKDDGTVVEWYDNETVSTGTFKAFAKSNPISVSFPLEDNAVYVQIKDSTTTLNFKVAKLTPEELQLVYMDRGGTLTYKLVK